MHTRSNKNSAATSSTNLPARAEKHKYTRAGTLKLRHCSCCFLFAWKQQQTILKNERDSCFGRYIGRDTQRHAIHHKEVTSDANHRITLLLTHATLREEVTSGMTQIDYSRKLQASLLNISIGLPGDLGSTSQG